VECGCVEWGHVEQRMLIGVRVTLAPHLFRRTLPCVPGAGAHTHIPKPQAHWLLLVQWGLEAGLGRSLWIIPYAFSFCVCAGERCRGGFVLLLGVVFLFGEEYLTDF